MKKKILTTLLIGATLGSGISALSTSSVDACRLTREVTIADNVYGKENVVSLFARGKHYKHYKADNWYCSFVDICEELYCVDRTTNRPVTGLFRHNNATYYFRNGKAVSGTVIVNGFRYDFDHVTFKQK